jgi:hypothetical protein
MGIKNQEEFYENKENDEEDVEDYDSSRFIFESTKNADDKPNKLVVNGVVKVKA